MKKLIQRVLVLLSIVVLIVACTKDDSPKTADTTSVTIGSQIWTTKNLDVTTYRNGDVIPQVTDPAAWANLTTGAWCYYNNDPANGATYGKLYNWYAVHDARGLAPVGWHVPSDTEWTTLTTYLGGDSVAGGKMKATTGWNSPNTDATNNSGFTGLPGGFCNYNTVAFDLIGYFGHWWSSTATSTDTAKYLFLFDYNGYITRGDTYMSAGFSVRCLRD